MLTRKLLTHVLSTYKNNDIMFAFEHMAVIERKGDVQYSGQSDIQFRAKADCSEVNLGRKEESVRAESG